MKLRSRSSVAWCTSALMIMPLAYQGYGVAATYGTSDPVIPELISDTGESVGYLVDAHRNSYNAFSIFRYIFSIDALTGLVKEIDGIDTNIYYEGYNCIGQSYAKAPPGHIFSPNNMSNTGISNLYYTNTTAFRYFNEYSHWEDYSAEGDPENPFRCIDGRSDKPVIFVEAHPNDSRVTGINDDYVPPITLRY